MTPGRGERRHLKAIDVFGYTDYRLLLRAVVEARIADNPRLSYRGLAKKAGFGSPNYLQQVIRGERALSVKTAAATAEAIGLTGLPRRYFAALAALAATNDLSERAEITGQLRQFLLLSKRSIMVDADIHGHWLHGVIYELATLRDFVLTAATAKAHLSNMAPAKDVEESLAFLLSRGYLVETEAPGRYRQAPVYLSPYDDVETLSLRQCHLKFLDVAKDRLTDPLDRREFQSLTMAISRQKLPRIKKLLREFVKDLRQELADDGDADEVFHLECCAFLLRPQQEND